MLESLRQSHQNYDRIEVQTMDVDEKQSITMGRPQDGLTSHDEQLGPQKKYNLMVPPKNK